MHKKSVNWKTILSKNNLYSFIKINILNNQKCSHNSIRKIFHSLSLRLELCLLAFVYVRRYSHVSLWKSRKPLIFYFFVSWRYLKASFIQQIYESVIIMFRIKITIFAHHHARKFYHINWCTISNGLPSEVIVVYFVYSINNIRVLAVHILSLRVIARMVWEISWSQAKTQFTDGLWTSL